ncbi:arsenate reductase [Dehalogenimonas sp. WBC-2]|nr:arsenate reductase [Dehalogenimonas sp. WBC-2]
MAEILFNHYAGDKARSESAGTAPGGVVNPVVVEVMKELGFDLSAEKPRLLTHEMILNADKVITMGCMKGEGICPVVFTPAEDWALPDPKGQDIVTVRQIRDEIKTRVIELVKHLGVVAKYQ